MTRQRALVAVLLLIAVAVVAGLLLIPQLNRHNVLSGYIEGEPLYLAAPVAGTVKAMYVVRGQDVAAGGRLFVVDPQQVVSARDQAAAPATSQIPRQAMTASLTSASVGMPGTASTIPMSAQKTISWITRGLVSA